MSMYDGYVNFVNNANNGVMESFVIMQWKRKESGRELVGETEFLFEFPDTDAIREAGETCDYVTIEKRYETLPFA